MITENSPHTEESLVDFAVHFSPSNRVAFSLSPVSTAPILKTVETRYGRVAVVESDAYSKVFPPDGACSLSLESLVNLASSSPLACPLVDKKEIGKNFPSLPKKKNFTRGGKQTLLSGGGALEKEGYKPEDFYFMTGTLPGGTDYAKKQLAIHSGFIINRLKQFLRDYEIYLTLNCWENQKRGALHLHLIYVCPDEKIGAKMQVELEQKWFDLLDEISKISGHNLYQQERGHHAWTRHDKQVKENCVKIIRCSGEKGSSPVAYLAKYLGKGFTSDIERCTKVKSYFPTSWWSISNGVRDLIKEYSRCYSVRLPASLAFERFVEFSEQIIPCAKLVLNPFTHPLFPDYVYRDIYLESSDYLDIADYFASLFPASNSVSVCDLSVDSGAASVTKYSYPALEYLRLNSNHSLCNKFASSYLSVSPSSAVLAANFFYSDSVDSATLSGLKFLEEKAVKFLVSEGEKILVKTEVSQWGKAPKNAELSLLSERKITDSNFKLPGCSVIHRKSELW